MSSKKRFTDKILKEFDRNNESSYMYISARVKPHIYYMLDFIAHLGGKGISVVITEQLREVLFEMVILYFSDSDVSEEEAMDVYNFCPDEIKKRLLALDIFDENYLTKEQREELEDALSFLK